VVTWERDGDIFAQRYESDHNTNGDEFLINTHTADTQSSSAVTALGDGGFVVTWLSQNQDNNGSGLYAQLFDDGANRVGDEFNITGYISGEANIAPLGYHEFIATWSYGGQIYSKILSYDGSQLSTIVLDTGSSLAPVDENAPVANNDTATVDEEASVTIDVLANDTDVNGDTLSVTAASAVNGGVVINTDGTLTYTGNQNFNGADTITYTLSDGTGLTVNASVAVTVNPVNDDPVSNNDTATTDANTAVTIDVLSNDSDVDGDVLSVDAVSANNGTVSVNSDDTIEYVPDTDFSGDDVVSYTADDGNGGTDTATVNVTVVADEAGATGNPFVFSAEAISGKEASIELYNDDYSTAPNEAIIKLTLNVDMARIDDTTVDSIAGAVIDLNIDWSQYELFTIGSENGFIAKQYMDGAFLVSADETTGAPLKITLASTNVSTAPLLTIVDNIDTQPWEGTDMPSSMDLGAIYLKPISSIDTVNVSYSASYSANQGGLNFAEGSSETVSVETSLTNAVISTADGLLIDNTSIIYLNNGVDTNVQTLVEEGGIKIEESVSFDSIKLSDDIYNFDIQLNDAINALRHVANLDTLTGAGFHAADVNNDSDVTLADAINILRHVANLDVIDTFDLIDQNGDLVTSLDVDSVGIDQWTIVANGDVNQSGGFDDLYTVAIDIV
ncbi:MAG: tandem-95 repeat protein, partial [Porticoccaceae bacterium]|nr:tandem-95 repeat protein [Porticoccaceae bacterium]